MDIYELATKTPSSSSCLNRAPETFCAEAEMRYKAELRNVLTKPPMHYP